MERRSEERRLQAIESHLNEKLKEGIDVVEGIQCSNEDFMIPVGLPGPWDQLEKRIGNGRTLLKYAKVGKGHILMKEWAEKYGPMYGFFTYEPSIGTMGLRVIMTDPEIARTILKLNPTKPHGYETSIILGKGVLSNNNKEEWAKQRTTLKQAFTPNSLKSLIPLFVNSLEEFMIK